mmetsp:Transcript_38219/g.82650  ORF Transcript_38219/g.82650 Transcript_38219/m.82650 type:complete len:224 (+) Transcript_38219:577-1248(+)
MMMRRQRTMRTKTTKRMIRERGSSLLICSRTNRGSQARPPTRRHARCWATSPLGTPWQTTCEESASKRSCPSSKAWKRSQTRSARRRSPRRTRKTRTMMMTKRRRKSPRKTRKTRTITMAKTTPKTRTIRQARREVSEVITTAKTTERAVETTEAPVKVATGTGTRGAAIDSCADMCSVCQASLRSSSDSLESSIELLVDPSPRHSVSLACLTKHANEHVLVA